MAGDLIHRASGAYVSVSLRHKDVHRSNLPAQKEYALVEEVGGHHEGVGVRLLVGSEAPLTQIHSYTNVCAHKLTDFIQSPNVDGVLGDGIVQLHDAT